MRKLHLAIRNPKNGNSHRIEADGEYIDEMEILFRKAAGKNMLAILWTDDDKYDFHRVLYQTYSHRDFERKFCCS